MTYDEHDIKKIRAGGKLLGQILAEVSGMVKPGVSTLDLDNYAQQRIVEVGGTPSFLGYTGGGDIPFPSTLCISINNEVVHGPATPVRILQEGDIVGLDIGMRYEGFCTDTALTVAVGAISEDASSLMRVTNEALALGIAAAQPGNRVRDIGKAIQEHIKKAGYGLVRDLVGHGVGIEVHEAPEIPNFVVRGPIGDYRLHKGLVIAIEPMVNLGEAAVKTLDDGWTIITRDGSLSAHFEHTIVINEDGPEILTQRSV